MKKCFLFFSFLFTISSFAQDLTKYSYVLVPEKFSFLKEADQHQLNSLTKFLFEKNGFETFIEGEESYLKLSPERCDGLYADVTSDSGLFRTKLKVTLKDCRNQQVFISSEGVSREKDYKTAYQEALREAFKSFEDLNYVNKEVIVSATPNLEVKPDLKVKEIFNESPSEFKNQDRKVIVAEIKEERQPNSISPEKKEVTQSSPEKKIIPAEDNEDIKSSGKLEKLNFSREGRDYFLQKTNNGYNLFQKGMTEPFATLISSSAGNNFIYSSMTAKGMVQIDKEGNLIIEILKGDNSLETITYQVRD